MINIPNSILYKFTPDILNNIKNLPGVYIFTNKGNLPIYIGKAKNLYNRIQYYIKQTSLAPRTLLMVNSIFNAIIKYTETEEEAINLEYQLIKKYKPYFNIEYMDDKLSYSILLEIENKIPRVSINSEEFNNGIRYGHFLSRKTAQKFLDNINTDFKIRTCSDKVFKHHEEIKKPCILYELKKCSAPCIINNKNYISNAKKLNTILSGNYNNYIDKLKKDIQKLSNKLKFEQAILLRDRIQFLQKYIAITPTNISNTDILVVVKLIESDYLLSVIYAKVQNNNIIIQFNRIVYKDNINLILNRLNHKKQLIVSSDIQLDIPNSKTESESIMYLKNVATQYLKEYLIQNNKNYKGLHILQKFFNMDTLPIRIECYDISHINGEFVVGSMVVFNEGKAEKQLYRRFKLSIDKNNDYEAIEEILTRRFNNNTDISFSIKPNLIILDGGYGQLKYGLKALKKHNLNIPICGFSKNFNEIWQSTKSQKLPYDSEGLYMLQRIRDEAHRFAISYHKYIRNKNTFNKNIS